MQSTTYFGCELCPQMFQFRAELDAHKMRKHSVHLKRCHHTQPLVVVHDIADSLLFKNKTSVQSKTPPQQGCGRNPARISRIMQRTTQQNQTHPQLQKPTKETFQINKDRVLKIQLYDVRHSAPVNSVTNRRKVPRKASSSVVTTTEKNSGTKAVNRSKNGTNVPLGDRNGTTKRRCNGRNKRRVARKRPANKPIHFCQFCRTGFETRQDCIDHEDLPVDCTAQNYNPQPV